MVIIAGTADTESMKRFWLCVEVGGWIAFALCIALSWLTMFLDPRTISYWPPFGLGLPICLLVVMVAHCKRGGSLDFYG
jgi:uncharacterized membrane protein